MTRERAKELLPIIQAFAEGKTIEYSSNGEDWREINTPMWRLDKLYRIKPKPKYRPFKSQEECWEEMQKHQPFGWLISKESRCYAYISKVSTSVTSDYAMITLIDAKYYANYVFNNYTFLDGTPFGIKE